MIIIKYVCDFGRCKKYLEVPEASASDNYLVEAGWVSLKKELSLIPGEPNSYLVYCPGHAVTVGAAKPTGLAEPVQGASELEPHPSRQEKAVRG